MRYMYEKKIEPYISSVTEALKIVSPALPLGQSVSFLCTAGRRYF